MIARSSLGFKLRFHPTISVQQKWSSALPVATVPREATRGLQSRSEGKECRHPFLSSSNLQVPETKHGRAVRASSVDF